MGESVHAVSALYDTVSTGTVVAWLTGGWYETDQTVVYGWSGSPELDTQGRVWGIVSQCPVVYDVSTSGMCQAGHTIVAGLP